MAWNDVLAYVRGAATKRGVVSSAERADDHLPLQAHIGSLVQMQHSPVIRAQADGSLIAMPTEADTRVVAVSQVKLDPGAGLYRLYLDKGGDKGGEKFLQVFSAADGSVAEIMYCTQLVRFVPESAEDQDAFTGAGERGLGDQSFTLWREQLADTLDSASLAAAFGESDRLEFIRDAGAADAAFVPPFTGHETRIDDPQGMHGLRQQVYFMPYVRQLPSGGREYLLITTEIVESVDGDTSRRGIHVDFVIGIPMEQERVVVQ